MDTLAGDLRAVSRGFRDAIAQPVCWQGHDITFRESHLMGLVLTTRGEVSWGKAFSVLPALREARTLRLASFADRGLRARALLPLRAACLQLCPRVGFLHCSFCEDHHGEQIDLPTPRKLTAARRHCPVKGGGLLFGCGPLLEAAGGGRGFAIRIETLPIGERLDIGLTTLSPHEQFLVRRDQRIAFAEDLCSSWIVESSGLLVGSHGGLRIRDERWDARRLRTGDLLGLLAEPSGELTLSVNGTYIASWRAQIPTETPIYPVVDLFEGSPIIQMVPHALPE